MMRNHRIGKITALLLSLCLTLGSLSVQAAVSTTDGEGNQPEVNTPNVEDDESRKVLNLNMGASALGKPKQDEDLDKWTGSKVKFGKTTKDVVGTWRVLDNEKLMLHSEQSYGNYTNQKEALKSDSEIEMEKYFSEEASAINSMTYEPYSYKIGWVLSEGEPDTKAPTFFHNLVNAKTSYLLDMEAAGNPEYGYVNNATRMIGNSGWWTRSSQMEGEGEKYGAAIGKDGQYVKVDSTNTAEYGYFPVIELDSSKIAFTSPAGWKKPEDVAKIEEYEGGQDVWKFTLFGTEGKLEAKVEGDSDSDGTWNYKVGSQMKVTYTRPWDILSDYSQVSALFTRIEGASEVPAYYGKISDNKDAEKTEITLSDIEPGQYQLYVFAEKVNSGDATDSASCLGDPIPVTIYDEVKIVTLPTAGEITYGQSLSQSALSNGTATATGGVEVAGTFSWKGPNTVPNAGEDKEFEIVFEPNNPFYKVDDEVKKVSVKVNPADQAPNYPTNLITNGLTAGCDKRTIADTAEMLPIGWVWEGTDRDQPLVGGQAVEATAIYENHGNNYINYTAKIQITRKADAHNYQGQVTKEPTTQEEGVKTYTCSICGHTYTESIPKLGSSVPPLTYYDITALPAAHGTIELSRTSIYKYGSVDVILTPEAGYQVKDLRINGKSVGAVSKYTIKDIDEDIKVSAVFAETQAHKNARLKKGVKNTSIQLKSVLGKGYIRLNWSKSAGYKVDQYQVFRSTKRYEGYGTKPYWITKSGGLKNSYKNTKELKKGTRYYYKVRGVREIAGKKVYTQWSNKAWRLVK